MPSAAAVFKWLADNDKPGFVEQYARAREAQADAMAEDILDIADNAINDWMERKGQHATGYEVNSEHIQRSRLSGGRPQMACFQNGHQEIRR